MDEMRLASEYIKSRSIDELRRFLDGTGIKLPKDDNIKEGESNET